MSDKLIWNAKEKVTLLLSLVPYVLEHGPTPIEELAQRFRIPAREVRRLAQFIGTAGIPGESLAALDNDLFDIDWDALLDDDVLDITRTIAIDDVPRFSGTEAAAILAGLSHLRALLREHDPAASAAAERAARKMSAATSPSRTEVSLEVAPPPVPPAYDVLSRALEEQRNVSFAYVDRKGNVTSRTVDPHHLVQGADTWYLRGYSHERQEERMFRLDSMSNVTIGGPVQAGLPASTLGTVSERFPEHAFDTEVIVIVYPDVRYLLDAWNPRLLETREDGTLLMSVALVHPERVIDLICVAPTGIEVVEPQELRAFVRDWATSLISEGEHQVTMIG